MEATQAAETLSSLLLLVAGAGLASMLLQLIFLLGHLRREVRRPTRVEGISILKPLCGVDDALRSNLESFARLEYDRYEVLLGVRDTADAAYPIARAVAQRWPHLMRVVLQRGEPGLNPKVNQLITLGAHARHELLVISDSNVAVAPDYLDEIAAHLEDPDVGLVAHLIAGRGEQTTGAWMDNAHLSVGITPGVVAAKALLDFTIVIGKSMAFRREDLYRLGGFEAVKDVLAEDFVLGQRMQRELGKQVVIASRPIDAVSGTRSVASCLDRYARWGTIQRKSVGNALYVALLLQHPLPLALLGVLLDPTARACAALLAYWTLKAAFEDVTARAIRGDGFALRSALALPAKDGVMFAAWFMGLRSHVTWRGTRLCVMESTRLVPVLPRHFHELDARTTSQ